MKLFGLACVSLALLACGGRLGENDAGTTALEAGPDAAACVDLETSDFDTSCTDDGDCVAVAAGGPVCDGYACLCPNATISASSQPAYEATLEKVTPAANGFCGCPLFGTPHCIASQCVFCPNPSATTNTPPGCPDGGP